MLIRDLKVKNIGEKKKEALHKKGFSDVRDLLFYIPFRYEDRRPEEIPEYFDTGRFLCLKGKIDSIAGINKGKIKIQRAELLLENGRQVTAVWFNQPHVLRLLEKGKNITVYGRADNRFGPQINVSDFAVEGSYKESDFGMIVPVYPAVSGLTQNEMRRIVAEAFRHSGRTELLTEKGFVREELLFSIHFGQDSRERDRARKLLAEEELFVYYLNSMSAGTAFKKTTGIAHSSKNPLILEWNRRLPYRLTDAQIKVIREINDDMEKPWPMFRLLQGDVGSGKTAVAQWALLKAAGSGFQAVFMAPTDILAKQHYAAFCRDFEGFGYRIVLLTGSLGSRGRKVVMDAIEKGDADIIVGTHAVFQEKVVYRNPGLIIVDEQHRFGVRQRLLLQQKGSAPDVLAMTATPIPRTLTMTLYGDMDISMLDEMPGGRKKIITRYVPENETAALDGFLKKMLAAGEKIFVVCPLIEESEKADYEDAVRVSEKMRRVFPSENTVLLHGRMSSGEKEAAVESFRRGESRILVATTVIEVGIDIPDANIMVIESSERFGLSQLHQLRGRTGRGGSQGYCFLKGKQKTERLKVFEQTDNGFELAELDLAIRGPGQLLGTRQHGLPDFRFADFAEDSDLLSSARKKALRYLNETAGIPDENRDYGYFDREYGDV